MGEHYVRKRMEIIRNFMTQRLAHLIAIAKESTTMIAKVNVPSTISICTFVQLPLVTKKMKQTTNEECPTICPAVFNPVCGTDGKTYSNPCRLGVANCLNKTNITVAHPGTCSNYEGLGSSMLRATQQGRWRQNCKRRGICGRGTRGGYEGTMCDTRDSKKNEPDYCGQCRFGWRTPHWTNWNVNDWCCTENDLIKYRDCK